MNSPHFKHFLKIWTKITTACPKKLGSKWMRLSCIASKKVSISHLVIKTFPMCPKFQECQESVNTVLGLKRNSKAMVFNSNPISRWILPRLSTFTSLRKTPPFWFYHQAIGTLTVNNWTQKDWCLSAWLNRSLPLKTLIKGQWQLRPLTWEKFQAGAKQTNSLN